jgi:hypothetical protein
MAPQGGIDSPQAYLQYSLLLCKIHSLTVAPVGDNTSSQEGQISQIKILLASPTILPQSSADAALCKPGCPGIMTP